MELLFKDVNKRIIIIGNNEPVIQDYTEPLVRLDTIKAEEKSGTEEQVKEEENIFLVEKKKKQYVREFINRNKEKIKEKQTCEICYSTYTYFNKSKHNKTKRHLALLNARNNIKNVKLSI
jgi:hypothetical protein